MAKEKTYCSPNHETFTCMNCYDTKWLITDETITDNTDMIPYIYESFDDLMDGEELIRCWLCNNINWSLYQQYNPAPPSFEETAC